MALRRPGLIPACWLPPLAALRSRLRSKGSPALLRAYIIDPTLSRMASANRPASRFLQRRFANSLTAFGDKRPPEKKTAA